MFKKRILNKLESFNKETKNKLTQEQIDELYDYFSKNLTRVCLQGDEMTFLSPVSYQEYMEEIKDFPDKAKIIPEIKGYLL